MDKFSRTTEIDTTGVLNAIEQDTPKKSRTGNIIAFVLCVLAAIVIWLYVMDTDAEIIENEYLDVVDYEIEFEVSSNIQEANKTILDLFEENNIKDYKKAISKRERAVKKALSLR